MRKPVVAFQGERGAYSEEAIRQAYGAVEVLPCQTFREAIESVERKEADIALLPIENSTEGQVSAVHDLLVETKLKAVREIYLRVRHCLLALPGQSLDDIREVYSHPQALGQCIEFLHKRLPRAKAVSYYDTAGAAKMLAEQKKRGAAAVASATAGELYRLESLARGIEDNPRNTTRFLAFSSKAPATSGPVKTSLVLRLPSSDKPGALYHALGAFANRGLNLTRIESRPTKGAPWEYLFFLDFEGSPDQPAGRAALAELRKAGGVVKIVGAYAKGSVEVA